MRKIVFNKKFLAAVGIVLAVGGCFFVKGKMNTKAADDSIFVQNMSVQFKQCEGTSKDILEEVIDENISEEIMALEEKGHTYEIGEELTAQNGYFIPVIKQIEDETAYEAIGGFTVKKKNYVVKVKSDQKITESDVETALEAVKEQLN